MFLCPGVRDIMLSLYGHLSAYAFTSGTTSKLAAGTSHCLFNIERQAGKL